MEKENQYSCLFKKDLELNKNFYSLSENDFQSVPKIKITLNKWNYFNNKMNNHLLNEWFNSIKNNQVLLLNEMWWKTEGTSCFQNIFSRGFYNRDEILKENSNSELLIEINKYVITLESQSPISGKTYINYKTEIREKEVQIPYIEFLLPISKLNNFVLKMDESNDYIIFSQGSIFKHPNKKLKSLGKYNRIPLTYDGFPLNMQIPSFKEMFLEKNEIYVETSFSYESECQNDFIFSSLNYILNDFVQNNFVNVFICSGIEPLIQDFRNYDQKLCDKNDNFLERIIELIK